MNARPIGYDERTMAILRGLAMARGDWIECLEAAAHALVGCSLATFQQLTPAHVIHVQSVPVTIVADHKELPQCTWYANMESTVAFYRDEWLSCGHPRAALRFDRDVSGLPSCYCTECETERAKAGAGNGG